VTTDTDLGVDSPVIFAGGGDGLSTGVAGVLLPQLPSMLVAIMAMTRSATFFIQHAPAMADLSMATRRCRGGSIDGLD
jgi:hypothetical protein